MSSLRFARAWMAALALGFLPSPALAIVPRITSTVVANPSFSGTVNTMMYTVAVTVDSTAADPDHSAVVGYASEDDYTTCNGTTAWKWARPQRFNTTATRTWTLYNFIPGKQYYYKITVGTGATARSRCGALSTTDAPTPTLPTNLSYLNLQYQKSGAPFDTKYVLFESDDCGTGLGGARDTLIVVDAVNETIVWYLDVAAASNRANATGGGFRYQPGPTSTSGRILFAVGKSLLVEWGFDGAIVNQFDFTDIGACDGRPGSDGPCLHHDMFMSDYTGDTYVMTAALGTITTEATVWEDACGTDTPFVNDGFTVLDDSFALASEHYLMDDYGYDPAVDGGPHASMLASRPHACSGDTWSRSFPDGVVDWTHANSLAASRFGGMEVVDMSIKEFDQVVRFNARTGALVWTLSADPAYTDWGTMAMGTGVVGDARFADQHDVHAIAANTLMMLDNQGDSGGARALQIYLDASVPSATIEKSWAMVNAGGDPLECELEGSAAMVPGSEHAFILCANLRIASELDDPTGNTGSAPPLVISLPNGDTDAFCTAGGPTERSGLRGWHRAFPLATVGAF